MGRPPPNVREPTEQILATMLTPSKIGRLVGEGIVAACQPETEQVNTSRLKTKKPELFDGKTTTGFNQWWGSVSMYLGFYPEMVD